MVVASTEAPENPVSPAAPYLSNTDRLVGALVDKRAKDLVPWNQVFQRCGSVKVVEIGGAFGQVIG